MASSSHRVAGNFRDVITKTASLRLADLAPRDAATYVDLVMGTGVPSGGYGRAAGTTMLYFREDAADTATAIYLSVNGGTAWTALNPSSLSGGNIVFSDTFAAKFGTPGTDLVLTADGTDVIVTGTGDLVFNDSVDLAIGTGKDIVLTWDGTRMNVTQALADSEIRFGVDGAGIDQRWYGDTAGAALLWDQSADALTCVGAAAIGSHNMSIGASTAAAGTTTADAGVLPAGTASVYPTTAADGTKGVRINASDKVTGRHLLIGNGVAGQILKVYPPSGGTINGAAADAAFASVSGKGVQIVCLSSAGNTWLAW